MELKLAVAIVAGWGLTVLFAALWLCEKWFRGEIEKSRDNWKAMYVNAQPDIERWYSNYLAEYRTVQVLSKQNTELRERIGELAYESTASEGKMR